MTNLNKIFTDIESEMFDKIQNFLLENFLDKDLSRFGNFINDLRDTYRNTELEFDYDSGVCKLVLLFTNFPHWVIKLDTCSNSNCNIEYENYLAAKEEGLERFFPETYRYDLTEDFWIFIQEAAICNSSEFEDTLYEYASEQVDRECDEDDEDYSYRVDSYQNNMNDEENVEVIIGYEPELINFLYRRGINDLHSGNFGFIEGNPVIIDFCGW